MTADDLNALVVTLEPPPAENLIFVNLDSTGIDTIREFCAGHNPSPNDPQVTFIMAHGLVAGPLSEHIFSCHSPAASTTLFVAEGALMDQQREELTKMGYTVVQVMTNGRPIAECLMTKQSLNVF